MLKILPIWLWVPFMILLLLVGVATGEIIPVLIIVGASVGLTALVHGVGQMAGGGSHYEKPGRCPICDGRLWLNRLDREIFTDADFWRCRRCGYSRRARPAWHDSDKTAPRT